VDGSLGRRYTLTNTPTNYFRAVHFNPPLANRPKSNLLTITTEIEKRQLIFAISGAIIVIAEIFRIFKALLKFVNFLVGR